MTTHDSYPPAADTFPYFIRLSVDVDPDGHPIARHATLFQEGKDLGTVTLAFPGPFDSIADAFSDLAEERAHYLGSQPTLF